MNSKVNQPEIKMSSDHEINKQNNESKSISGAKIFNNEFGNLDWVDIRPLKDGQACFEEILEGKTLFPKIILKP